MFRLFKHLSVIFIASLNVSCMKLVSDDNADFSSTAQEYLTRYGYMKDLHTTGISSPLLSLDKAVAKFQAFAGLEQTGKLDKETIELMLSRRCGVGDIIEEDEDSPRKKQFHIKIRSKRYALQGSRWRVKNLTYKITKYPSTSRLSQQDVDDTFRKAFNVWEKETDLKFEPRTSGKVHIEIRFERKFHGDDDPFDGEGGTLAHAFFPVFGGDAHFDDDEDWTVNTFRGTSLLMTASHELGHSLGLSHSNVRSSLMAPFYRGYERDVSLDTDDIEGIQALYGEKTNTKDNAEENSIGVRSNIIPPVFEPDNKKPDIIDNDELCRNGKIDTIVTMKDDITYAFWGSKYWKLTDTSVTPGYPREISDDWNGLPGNLDGSFTWRNGKTYFFKGSNYWRFSDVGKMDSGYPRELSKGFSGIPNDIDAAMVWAVNDKIYFFKGSKYWKFDPDQDPPVEDTYPRPVSNWDGIPNNLDSAMQYSNGKTYFFKDGQYYRFDDEKFELDRSANPSFPRETGFWWFGCDANSVRLTKKSEEEDDYVIEYDDSSFNVMWAAFN